MFRDVNVDTVDPDQNAASVWIYTVFQFPFYETQNANHN